VKGKRKEREDSDKDDPGQPETAHIHKIHKGRQKPLTLNLRPAKARFIVPGLTSFSTLVPD
jgi:hypothetical protein